MVHSKPRPNSFAKQDAKRQSSVNGILSLLPPASIILKSSRARARSSITIRCCPGHPVPSHQGQGMELRPIPHRGDRGLRRRRIQLIARLPRRLSRSQEQRPCPSPIFPRMRSHCYRRAKHARPVPFGKRNRLGRHQASHDLEDRGSHEHLKKN